MHTLWQTISLIASVFLTAPLCAQIEVYVSLSGDDSQSGSISEPFATVAKARDYLRTQQPLSSGATVHIREGEYFFTSSLSLSGTQDSGSSTAPIVYAAYNGEKVIFSGAQPLNFADFSSVTDPTILNRVIDVPTRALLKQITLPGGIDLGSLTRRGWGKIISPGGTFPTDPVIDLIVGEDRMRLARWPNPSATPQNTGDPLGSVDLSSVVDPGPINTSPDFTTAGGTFAYNFSTNRPALWTSATDIWLSGPLDRAWEWDCLPVASINSGTQEITLGQGVDSGITTSETFFHFENLLEEIDEPGEYYLDRSTRVLYLYPPANFSTDPIRYTSLQNANLLNITNADHLEIRDIIFESSRGGGIRIQGDDIVVRRCELRNLLGLGIQLSGDDIGIVDSKLHHLGHIGILVGNYGSDTGIGDLNTLTPANVYIKNCEFYQNAYNEQNYRPSIQLLTGVSPRISHCYFHDNPHFSIGGRENNGIIEYCEFENTPSLFADVGAIYYNTGNNPDRQGTLIRRNYFHDIGADVERGKMSALYLDNASRGFVIEENIFNRIGIKSSDWAYFNHGAAPGVVRNNIFIDCTNPVAHNYALVLDSYMTISGFAPNWESILGAPGAPNFLADTEFLRQYPELATLIPADGNYESRKASPTAFIQRNLFYNPNTARLNTSDGTDDGIEFSHAPADTSGFLEVADNFVATSDPGFTDLANDDLSLLPTASAFTSIPNFNNPEFKRNGVKQMGLTRSVGPKSTPAPPASPTLSWNQGAFVGPYAITETLFQRSLTALATDSTPGATLTFEKVSGPDWVSVTPNGLITGTPTQTDLGLNQCAVRVISSTGETDECIYRIVVIPETLELMFSGDLLAQRDAIVDREYHGSLNLEILNPDWANLLTFTNLSGPGWLSISENGKLTGTPSISDLGLSTWSVTVGDGTGSTDQNSFTINVINAPGNILFVDGSSGNNSNNGQSWPNAKATIQAALTIATPGTEIRIAQGTYTGTLDPPSGVCLYGGFANGDTFADRSIATKQVIHSPAHLRLIAKNDVLIDGITFQNAPDGYAYPISIDTASGQPDTDNIVLQSCLITGNSARSSLLVRGWQGQRVHNVSILDTTISNNSASGDFAGTIGLGGIYGEVSFERCLLRSNSVGTNILGPGSGAIDFTGPNALRVENSILYGNTTQNPGLAIGISTRGGARTHIINNTFDGAGSASGVGNALVSSTGGSGVVIANNAFVGSPRAALHNTVTASTTLQNNLFSNNLSGITGTDTADTDTAISALTWSSQNIVDAGLHFLDLAAHDYRLLPGASVIDQASSTYAPPSDYSKITRPTPDIGAHEYDGSIQDSDGDLMTDDWETLYSLNNNNPSDGTIDSDGDGASNVAEFIMGSAPNSPASLWKANTSQGGSDSEAVITLDTITDRTYSIQRSYTLSPGSWTTEAVILGDGTVKQTNISAPTNETEVFYRVQVGLAQ